MYDLVSFWTKEKVHQWSSGLSCCSGTICIAIVLTLGGRRRLTVMCLFYLHLLVLSRSISSSDCMVYMYVPVTPKAIRNELLVSGASRTVGVPYI